MQLSIQKSNLILKQYQDYMGQRGYSERTQQNYQSNVSYYMNYLHHHRVQDLSQVEKDLIRRYQQHLFSETQLALRTQAVYLTALRDFYRYLERCGYLLHNPTSIIEYPRYNRTLPRNILSIKEIQTLFNTIDLSTPLGIRNRSIMELLYSNGIRTSELLNLSLEDIDLTHAQLTIRKGKGGKDRVVPIGEIALSYLEEYLRIARTNLKNAEHSPYVFISIRGCRLTRGFMSKMFRKYAKQVGIAHPIGAHTLRHSCATHMLEQGAPIRYIQELLGHSSLDTTQIYTRVEISHLKKVHKKTHPREL